MIQLCVLKQNFMYIIPFLSVQSELQRELTQIQYLAWPDHGVPDDSTDFLDFVGLVRAKRAGQDHPMVVHCRYSFHSVNDLKPEYLYDFVTYNVLATSFSAGIGRTGVLITMETALCLMECSQPVYPLDIVRTMRDQRAMMIQTPVRRHIPFSGRSQPLQAIS